LGTIWICLLKLVEVIIIAVIWVLIVGKLSLFLLNSLYLVIAFAILQLKVQSLLTS
jgi:hypothetical protein